MKPKSLFLRATTMLVIFLVMVTLNPISPALASTAGPNNPNEGTDLPDIGTIEWLFPNNITAVGPPYTLAVITQTTFTHYLQGSSYNFNIPSGSIIHGITVLISRQSSGSDVPYLRDYQVYLVKDGDIVGENKAITGIDWPHSTFGSASYGGPNDLWGTSWTPEEINAEDFGVVLSVLNPHPTMPRTATVDYMQVTINYTLPGTTTSVNCGNGTPYATVGAGITCVATVTRLAGDNTPSGTINWATDSSGSFSPISCTLAGSDGSATCTVSYTPSAVGSGSHLITATYAGDNNFTGSNGNQTITVNKGTPTLVVTNSPAFYDGTPQAAILASSVPGEISNVRYDGLATEPTDIGTYAVTADFVPLDTTNYLSLTCAPAGDFEIIEGFKLFLPLTIW